MAGFFMTAKGFIFSIVFMLGSLSIAYVIKLRTSPLKKTWKAKIYQVGDGVIPPLKDKEGNIVSDIKLRDLMPYKKDRIERVEKEKGIVIYRIIGLNKTVPAITTSCVERWSKDDEEVSVLFDNEVCTLLRRGYDENGRIVFNPLPYDTINMIQNEITTRQDRLKKEETNFWASITPIAIFTVAAFLLLGTAWLNGQGMIETDKTLSSISTNIISAQMDLTERLAKALESYGNIQMVSENLGLQNSTVTTS